MLQALYNYVGCQKNNTIRVRYSAPWTPTLGSNEQITATYTAYSFTKVLQMPRQKASNLVLWGWGQ